MAPRTGPAAPSALVEYLNRRIDELRERAVAAVRDGDVEAVHQARVLTRRLRAALDLLEPILPEAGRRRFARTLRRLRRA